MAELFVIHKFKQQGARLVSQRIRTPFAEVDLLFEKDKKFYLVEVKQVVDFSNTGHLIGQKQLRRLQKAFLYLLSDYPDLKPILAIVSQHWRIKYIENFL